ncbi:MAG: FHA domain-containing protein [Oligoflexia bacterium]|nr:FHA domain-containing protein [Oligoflexia bacterium]
MSVFLKILAAPEEKYVGVKISLIEGINVLGRVSPPSGIVLDSPKVSKKHCAIRLDKGHLQVDDLGSSNGIFLNGKKINSEKLQNKDRLVIGDFTLELVVRK